MTTERTHRESKPQKTPQPNLEHVHGENDQEVELSRPTFELTPENIARLQRTIGNQAVQRLLAQQRTAGQSAPALRTTPPPSPPSAVIEDEAQEAETEEEYENDPQFVQMNAAGGMVTPPPNQPSIAPIKPGKAEARVQRFGLGDMAEWAFEKALGLAGIPVGMVMGFLKRAGGLFMNIIKDPAGFLGNLVNGVKQGFTQFSANILTHLKSGFLSWLFGALVSAGIQIPKEFSMKSILSMVLQVLGVTVDNLRSRLVAFVGAKNVARVEKAWSVVSKLISEGVGGLWEMLKEHLSDLKTTVIDGIKDWAITEIVKGAVIKILSMFNPAGALIQVITTIYNIVKFLIERASQIAALGQAVLGSVAAIASGNVSELAQKIEQALANAIPVVLSFLASLLGINGLANKVREIIQKIQKKVNDAIDAVLKKIANGVKKLFGKGDNKQGTAPPATNAPDQQPKAKAGLAALHAEEQNYVKDGAIARGDAQKAASSVKDRYPVFASISVVEGEHGHAKTWDYDYTLVQRVIEPGKKEAEDASIDKITKAIAPIDKFSKYIFKPGAKHGKEKVFISLGYNETDSATLVQIFQDQALAKCQAGNYTLGKKDEYGQRIDIEIELQGIGASVGKMSYIKSGWMVKSDKTITLNTPFSGFTR